MPLVGDNLVLGADPGWNGYFALYQPRTRTCWLHEVDQGKKLDTFQWAMDLAKRDTIVYGVTEDVHSMPHDGKDRIFSFGKAAEFMSNTLMLMGAGKNFGIECCSPTKWQKGMSLILPKECDALDKAARRTELKKLQAKRAREIMKGVTFIDRYNHECNITQVNASAILMALFAQRLYARLGAK